MVPFLCHHSPPFTVFCNSTMTPQLREAIFEVEKNAFIYSPASASYRAKLTSAIAQVQARITSSETRVRVFHQYGCLSSISMTPATLVKTLYTGFANEIASILCGAANALLPRRGTQAAPGRKSGRGAKTGVRKRAIGKAKRLTKKESVNGRARKTPPNAVPHDQTLQTHRVSPVDVDAPIETPPSRANAQQVLKHVNVGDSAGRGPNAPRRSSPHCGGGKDITLHIHSAPAAPPPPVRSSFARSSLAQSPATDPPLPATPAYHNENRDSTAQDRHVQLIIDAILAGWSHEEASILFQWQSPAPGATIFDGSENQVFDRLRGTVYAQTQI